MSLLEDRIEQEKEVLIIQDIENKIRSLRESKSQKLKERLSISDRKPRNLFSSFINRPVNKPLKELNNHKESESSRLDFTPTAALLDLVKPLVMEYVKTYLREFKTALLSEVRSEVKRLVLISGADIQFKCQQEVQKLKYQIVGIQHNVEGITKSRASLHEDRENFEFLIPQKDTNKQSPSSPNGHVIGSPKNIPTKKKTSSMEPRQKGDKVAQMITFGHFDDTKSNPLSPEFKNSSRGESKSKAEQNGPTKIISPRPGSPVDKRTPIVAMLPFPQPQLSTPTENNNLLAPRMSINRSSGSSPKLAVPSKSRQRKDSNSSAGGEKPKQQYQHQKSLTRHKTFAEGVGKIV